MKTTAKLWMGIGILVLLSPLGLILPQYFKAGNAWGEWDAGALKGLVGYIPQGLAKLSGFWKAPVPDYTFKGGQELGPKFLSLTYIISAAAGVLAIVLIVSLLGKILVKKGDKPSV